MDNISHTLISVGLGTAIGRRLPAAGQRAAIWTAVIAGNIPDLDIVTSMFARQSKLMYLLHHRGHTHTILYALLIGLAVGWIAAWISQKNITEPIERKKVRTKLLLAGLLSALLHLFMDWWNLYGIHPFYPFNNQWYFGDAIFIVEPMIWLALVPFCLRISQRKGYRILICLVPLFSAGLALSFQAYGLLAALVSVLTVALVWDRKKPAHHSGFIICSTVIAAFFAGSMVAKGPVGSLPALPAGATFIDSALAPAPGNPFCWKFYTVSLDGSDYVVRTGVFSHLPAIVSPDRCYLERGIDGTAPTTPVISEQPNFAGISEYRIAREELKSLMTNCEFRAFTIFARMPFFAKTAPEPIFGDLRFDNEPGLGFSEFTLTPGADCPGLVQAPWIPPRLDELQ